MKHNKLTLLLLVFLLGAVWLKAQETINLQAFADSTKYGWMNYMDRDSYRNELNQRQNLLQLYELEALSTRDTFLKSLVMPGWGQFASKNNNKATVFMSLELAALMGSVYFYDRAMTNYRQYQSATQIDEINRYYGKSQLPYQYSLMAAGFGFVVWGYNLYDVIMSTNEYNEQLWKNIYERRSTSPLQLTPSGLELQF